MVILIVCPDKQKSARYVAFTADGYAPPVGTAEVKNASNLAAGLHSLRRSSSSDSYRRRCVDRIVGPQPKTLVAMARILRR